MWNLACRYDLLARYAEARDISGTNSPLCADKVEGGAA